MLTFGAPLKVADLKAVGDQYRVSGYVSTYRTVDLGNDVVMPGAFDKSLSDGHKIRFLAHHRPDQVLGVPDSLKSDKKGLFGQFRISRTQLGEETYQLLKDGALDSFSIGYIPRDYDYAESGDVRQLKDVELIECSVVSMPVNPDAVVTAVKEWAEHFGTPAAPPDFDQPFEDVLEAERTRLQQVLGGIKALYERRLSEHRGPTDAHKDAVAAYRAEVEALWREIDSLAEQGDQAKAVRALSGEALLLALRRRRMNAAARGVLTEV